MEQVEKWGHGNKKANQHLRHIFYSVLQSFPLQEVETNKSKVELEVGPQKMKVER